ncbi:MAG: alkaline shock response membrane anchor protein AmaP [Candidatus Omnitrophica bacterium]|nr:alkaline shock response membrane anchor protein AmaP [Candidatus Omnitrophota bacterium]
MRATHIILIIIGALVFLMVGCFLFFFISLGLIPIDNVYTEVKRLYDHRFITGCVGFFFLSIGYIAVKILIKRSHRDEVFIVDNDYGRTSISLIAIEDLIKKTLRRYDYVERFKLKVGTQNKVLTVRVGLVLVMGKSGSEAVEDVQNELQKKLITFVGLKREDLKITVNVSKVIERKVKKKG